MTKPEAAPRRSSKLLYRICGCHTSPICHSMRRQKTAEANVCDEIKSSECFIDFDGTHNATSWAPTSQTLVELTEASPAVTQQNSGCAIANDLGTLLYAFPRARANSAPCTRSSQESSLRLLPALVSCDQPTILFIGLQDISTCFLNRPSSFRSQTKHSATYRLSL